MDHHPSIHPYYNLPSLQRQTQRERERLLKMNAAVCNQAMISCIRKHTSTSVMSRRRSSTRAEAAIAIPETTRKTTELSVDLLVHEIVERQTRKPDYSAAAAAFQPLFLQESYQRCRDVCAEYAKTFYLGSYLITIYVLLLVLVVKLCNISMW